MPVFTFPSVRFLLQPPLLAKGLALQDWLGDLLLEILLYGAGGYIGKATYCGAYLAHEVEQLVTRALPR